MRSMFFIPDDVRTLLPSAIITSVRSVRISEFFGCVLLASVIVYGISLYTTMLAFVCTKYSLRKFRICSRNSFDGAHALSEAVRSIIAEYRDCTE